MTLAEEAQRYLAVVDFFRAEGCEPHWARETRSPSSVQPVGSPRALRETPKRA
jgi:hypothetical protein